MFDIDRHIEILLLKHNCVIVPGFGGFVAHHVCSRYDENDGVMLPPMRTVGFNPQLTLNDSLLIQSFIESYDVSYPEAQRMVEQEVEQMRATMEREGELEFSSIGRLFINEDGLTEFEPLQSGVLTPSLYALTTVEIDRLASEYKEEMEESATVPIFEENEEETEVASEEKETATVVPFKTNPSQPTIIDTSWYKLAAACVLLLFAFSIPFAIDNRVYKDVNLSFLDLSSLFEILPQDTQQIETPQLIAETKVPVQEVAQEETSVEESSAEEVSSEETSTADEAVEVEQKEEQPVVNTKAEVKKEAAKPEPKKEVAKPQPKKEIPKKQPTAKPEPKKEVKKPQPVAKPQQEVEPQQKQELIQEPQPKKLYYTIVLSSGANSAFAEDYVRNLHNRGYIAAYTCFTGQQVRVVHGRYHSYEDARQMRDNLQQLPEFEKCWVMEIQ